jgi:hypothetical protein
MGNVGRLGPEIDCEWIFWKVVKKFPEILAFEKKISYPDLQKFNAVIEMSEDYSAVLDELSKEGIKNGC